MLLPVMARIASSPRLEHKYPVYCALSRSNLRPIIFALEGMWPMGMHSRREISRCVSNGDAHEAHTHAFKGKFSAFQPRVHGPGHVDVPSARRVEASRLIPDPVLI